MKSSLKDQQGTMLIEGVIALLVLCLVILSLLMMAGIVVKSRQSSAMHYDQSFHLNSLRDEIALELQNHPTREPEMIRSLAQAIAEKYEHWQIGSVTLTDNLCHLDLIYTNGNAAKSYEVRLYVPQS